jgi:DICT domain-containing protein/predicted DNA-binding transcriptional regulator AlpA
LTIGALARRTGLGVSTIRAWERRHGFPEPQRLESGHRRYSERDVEAILAAVRDRHAGMSLGAALAKARASRFGPGRSVFGALRHALDGVAPTVMSKPAMVMLSRAVEDEIVGRAERPVLFGAFQAERFWRASEDRWRNLAATSTIAVALATFPQARHDGALWEVPVDLSAPLAREWVVMCDSATFSVCVAAVELPDDRVRTFEVLWSAEPSVTREAARVASQIAAAAVPELRGVADALQVSPKANYDAARATTALANRAIVYAAAATPRSDHG